MFAVSVPGDANFRVQKSVYPFVLLNGGSLSRVSRVFVGSGLSESEA